MPISLFSLDLARNTFRDLSTLQFGPVKCGGGLEPIEHGEEVFALDHASCISVAVAPASLFSWTAMSTPAVHGLIRLIGIRYENVS